MRNIWLALIIAIMGVYADAQPTDQEVQYYRDLTLKIRPAATFKVPMPDGRDMVFDYKFDIGDPIYLKPMVDDIHVTGDPSHFYRIFFDRIWLKDGSYARLAGEDVPLTCIFVDGQDNRYSGNTSPLFPQVIMKIYIVANDYTCKGPIRPGWPDTGGRKENWDTYVHYEIRDPTIMLPVETGLRYRWNEFSTILVR